MWRVCCFWEVLVVRASSRMVSLVARYWILRSFIMPVLVLMVRTTQKQTGFSRLGKYTNPLIAVIEIYVWRLRVECYAMR